MFRRYRTSPSRVQSTPRAPSPVAGWINPNARCPVCGALVYFYTNQHGSRVFFDDLGPPWPKHPCTDNPSMPVATVGDRPAPSRQDFNSARNPSRLRDRSWTSYAVKEIAVENGRSRVVLQPLYGFGAGPTTTIAGRLPLRVDDLVFVRGRHLSYFDSTVGGPRTVEDVKRADALARKLITERDQQHVLAALHAGIASGKPPVDDLATVTAGIHAARNRGELAAALKIDVTELKVAPPRPSDLWMLAIALAAIVCGPNVAGTAYILLVLPVGLLVAAVALYRLNSAIKRGPRFLLAVMATLLLICPAGVCSGAMLAVLLGVDTGAAEQGETPRHPSRSWPPSRKIAFHCKPIASAQEISGTVVNSHAMGCGPPGSGSYSPLSTSRLC